MLPQSHHILEEQTEYLSIRQTEYLFPVSED